MNLLIADDDKHTQVMLQAVIENMGYSTLLASDGLEAWELVQGMNTPGFIVLDWEMPGFTGPELCEKIRSIDPDNMFYIILCTGRDELNDIAYGLDSGANDYVAKPFDLKVLEARINVGVRMVESQIKQKELAQSLADANMKLTAANTSLELLSTTDALTGIPNRRLFFEALNKEFMRSKRFKTYLSLIMIDIDCFKAYNDTYGHVAGDLCLKQVAAAIKDTLKRPTDLVARYGGEEFICLLSNTNPDGAVTIASAMLKNVAKLNIANQESTCSDIVSVSIGLSTSICDTDSSQSVLLEKADKALYEAKSKGRNQLIVKD